MTTAIMCPKCGKVNDLADAEGFVEGPRDYHADCWRSTVLGKTIQHDNSGVGHNWKPIDARDIPADIAEEIAAEIIDGKQDSCDDYRATNSLHYRW